MTTFFQKYEKPCFWSDLGTFWSNIEIQLCQYLATVNPYLQAKIQKNLRYSCQAWRSKKIKNPASSYIILIPISLINQNTITNRIIFQLKQVLYFIGSQQIQSFWQYSSLFVSTIFIIYLFFWGRGDFSAGKFFFFVFHLCK